MATPGRLDRGGQEFPSYVLNVRSTYVGCASNAFVTFGRNSFSAALAFVRLSAPFIKDPITLVASEVAPKALCQRARNTKQAKH